MNDNNTYIYASGIEKFTEKYSNTFNVDVGTSGDVGRKVSFAGEVETSFNQNDKKTGIVDQLYFKNVFEAKQYYLMLASGTAELSNMLNPIFKNDLLAVDSVDEAKIVLNKYGTHMLRGVTMGGRLDVNYKVTKKKVTNSKDSKLDIATALKAKVNTMFFKNTTTAETEAMEMFNNAMSSEEVDLELRTSVLGGKRDVINITKEDVMTENFEEWKNSIMDNPAVCGIPNAKSLQPIWEILPDDLVRKDLFVQAFSHIGSDAYARLMDSYGYDVNVVDSVKLYERINDSSDNGKQLPIESDSFELEVEAGKQTRLNYSYLPTTAIAEIASNLRLGVDGIKVYVDKGSIVIDVANNVADGARTAFDLVCYTDINTIERNIKLKVKNPNILTSYYITESVLPVSASEPLVLKAGQTREFIVKYAPIEANPIIGFEVIQGGDIISVCMLDNGKISVRVDVNALNDATARIRLFFNTVCDEKEVVYDIKIDNSDYLQTFRVDSDGQEHISTKTMCPGSVANFYYLYQPSSANAQISYKILKGENLCEVTAIENAISVRILNISASESDIQIVVKCETSVNAIIKHINIFVEESEAMILDRANLNLSNAIQNATVYDLSASFRGINVPNEFIYLHSSSNSYTIINNKLVVYDSAFGQRIAIAIRFDYKQKTFTKIAYIDVSIKRTDILNSFTLSKDLIEVGRGGSGTLTASVNGGALSNVPIEIAKFEHNGAFLSTVTIVGNTIRYSVNGTQTGYNDFITLRVTINGKSLTAQFRGCSSLII